MCEPVSATTLLAANLAVAAGQTGLEIAGQNLAAKSQTAYQRQLVAANNAEAALQLSQLRIHQSQEEEAAARETHKARLASRAARSTAVVAAGEAGVSGNSAEAMLQEYAANLGQFQEASRRQRQLSAAGYDDKARAISAGARYQNLNINAPVTGANWAASLVRFSASALNSYGAYSKKDPGGK